MLEGRGVMRRWTARFAVERDIEAILVLDMVFVPFAQSVVCECNLQCSNAWQPTLNFKSAKASADFAWGSQGWCDRWLFPIYSTYIILIN